MTAQLTPQRGMQTAQERPEYETPPDELRTAWSGDPCPLFWPTGQQHAVDYVPLVTRPARAIEPLLPKLRELAALGDALRSLQASDGTVCGSEGASALARSSAELLLQIGQAVGGQTAEILSLRARALLGEGSNLDAAIREAASTTEPVSVLCGPVCTWRHKTRDPLHTVIGAARCDVYDELIARLDAGLDGARASLAGDLNAGDLRFGSVEPMCVTDMLVCGGEANAHPKHFGYFLPEDEAIPDTPGQRKKTIAFRNVYRSRYELISRPLGQALLRGPTRAREIPVERVLLSWFRGHDIAHSVCMDGTDYAWQEDIGLEPYMMLQEALADVYGFLLALTPSWLACEQFTLADLGATFMDELLHYLRRGGPWYYGDSGAAYLELSYLAQGGFVDIGESGEITWDAPRLLDGMRSLASTFLAGMVTARDAGPPAGLIERYGWPNSGPATRVLERLQHGLCHISTTFAYRQALPEDADAAEPDHKRASLACA